MPLSSLWSKGDFKTLPPKSKFLAVVLLKQIQLAALYFSSSAMSIADDGDVCISVSSNVWNGDVDSSWSNSQNWDFGPLFGLPSQTLSSTYFGPQGLVVNGLKTGNFSFPQSEAVLNSSFSTPVLTMAAFDGICQIKLGSGALLNTNATIGTETDPAHCYTPSGPIQLATLIFNGGGIAGTVAFHEHSRVVIASDHTQAITWNGIIKSLSINPSRTLTIRNLFTSAIANRGTLTFINDQSVSTPEVLYLSDTVTLNEGGEVVLNSPDATIAQGSGSGGLVNIDNTLRGVGNITAVTQNQGIIRAEGGKLRVNAGTSNGGRFETASDGILELNSINYGDGSGATLFGEPGGLVQGLGFGDGAIEGQVAVSASHFWLAGAIANGGVITFQNDTVISSPEVLYLSGTVTLNGGGEVVLNSPDATIAQDFGSGGLVNVDNTLRGVGNINVPVQNHAQIEPGLSPGKLTIQSLEQSSTASLQIDIRGTAPNQFDVLQVTGTAILKGTLNVRLLPNSSFVAGDTFDIVQAGAITGAFDQINLPTTSATQPLFTLSQVGNTIRLVANEDFSAAISFSDWALSQGLDNTNNDPLDDPNMDGITNLEAYTLGIPATGSNNGTGVTIDRSGNGVTIKFTTPLSVTGVSIGSEFNDNSALDTWISGPAPTLVSTTLDEAHYEITLPPTDLQRFARLTFKVE